jgi:hypothetical protein
VTIWSCSRFVLPRLVTLVVRASATARGRARSSSPSTRVERVPSARVRGTTFS